MSVQILIGGVDETGPHVFSLDPFGSLTEEKSASTGSGSPLAYGVLEDKFREGMTIEELLPIIVRAVNAAMKRDVASGNNYNIIDNRQERLPRAVGRREAQVAVELRS